MASAKNVWSARATSRTDLEDIVRSIAAELRAWKCSERDVLAKVHKTIDEFREDSAHPPDVGYRNENRQIAQDCIAVLDKAEKQLAKLPPTFIKFLARATYFDPTLVITCRKDWEELNRRKEQEGEILSKDWTELLERTARFAERCKQAIFAPIRLFSDSGELVDEDPTGVGSKIGYSIQDMEFQPEGVGRRQRLTRFGLGKSGIGGVDQQSHAARCLREGHCEGQNEHLDGGWGQGGAGSVLPRDRWDHAGFPDGQNRPARRDEPGQLG